MNEVKITGRKLSFSEAVRRLNPELFRMGQVSVPVAQPHTGRTLEQGNEAKEEGCRGMARSSGPVVRCTLISFRRRLITDSDNLPSGLKPLRDTIARWLRLDDRDSVIEWQYRQVETRGEQGTAVKIEVI